MPIDMRTIEPLAAKSVLFEQAMKRQQKKGSGYEEKMYQDMDYDEVPKDLEWIQQDNEKLRAMVEEMDAAVVMLAKQMRDTREQSERSRALIEKEQQLMFKQIQTLNNLLKKQVNIFSRMERQVSQIDIKQTNGLSHIAVGLLAGVASAITLTIAAPFATQLVQVLLTP